LNVLPKKFPQAASRAKVVFFLPPEFRESRRSPVFGQVQPSLQGMPAAVASVFNVICLFFALVADSDCFFSCGHIVRLVWIFSEAEQWDAGNRRNVPLEVGI
jgi:hypothetical protein